MPEFPRAVARDVRSYSHDVFLKTVQILQRERLVSEDVLLQFQKFIELVQDIAQKEKTFDDLIDDAPPEFLGIVFLHVFVYWGMRKRNTQYNTSISSPLYFIPISEKNSFFKRERERERKRRSVRECNNNKTDLFVLFQTPSYLR